LDEGRMLDAYGDVAKSYTLPAIAGELRQEIVPGWRFKPLRVRADAETAGLNVFIEPGRYEYLDTSYIWDSTAVTDLAVTVSSNMKRAVIVGIDPVAGTPVVASGTERSVTLPDMTLYDYNLLINANKGKLWLFGYQRKSGVSVFQSLTDLVDLRAYLSLGGGVTSGGSFMPIELDFALTIPANRQAMVHTFRVVDGGSLRVLGSFRLIGV
jgi:hypothetical protein